MNFAEIQALEAALAPRAIRAESDGAAIRAALIASGALRERAPAAPVPLPPGTVALDEPGLQDAAAAIWAYREGRVASLIPNVDPRIAERLRFLMAQLGAPRTEASLAQFA